MTNNILLGNWADNLGGGLSCLGFLAPYHRPKVTNNVIMNNGAAREGGGGGILSAGPYCCPEIYNTILRDNIAPVNPEIYIGEGTIVVNYCNVKGGWSGTGNIDADPMFVDELNGDFHFRLGSPCVDAGTNNAPSMPDSDYEGDERIADGDLDGEAIADIGVDELFAEIAARFGNVNSAEISIANVLKVNGGPGDNKRVYSTTTGTPLTLTMDLPYSGPNPADFALYVITYEPGVGDMAIQPYSIGTSCMPMPLSNGNPKPPPFTLVNNIGYNSVLGKPILSGIPPAPCTVFDKKKLPLGTYTMQGYIFDGGSAGNGISLTNAIVLKVE